MSKIRFPWVDFVQPRFVAVPRKVPGGTWVLQLSDNTGFRMTTSISIDARVAASEADLQPVALAHPELPPEELRALLTSAVEGILELEKLEKLSLHRFALLTWTAARLVRKRREELHLPVCAHTEDCPNEPTRNNAGLSVCASCAGAPPPPR